MAQPILKRRLNPLLLISTVAALALLAGVSVIAQDQISQKQTELNELRDRNANLNTSVNEMDSRLENRSIKLRSLEDEVSRLRVENENLSSTLDGKEEELDELEEELEQEESSTLGSSDQGLIEDINGSLEVVCTFGAPFGGENANLAETECVKRGHQIGN